MCFNTKRGEILNPIYKEYLKFLQFNIAIILVFILVGNMQEQINSRDRIISEQLAMARRHNAKLSELKEQVEAIKLELDRWEIITMEVTAYAPLDNISGICADDSPNVTATGTTPSHGTIAVNPEIIPYGTRMFIPGYGWGIAEDTGAAIRQRDDLIDIYKDKHYQAIEWGRRTLQILIERNG